MTKTLYNEDIVNSTSKNPFSINEIYQDYLNKNVTNTFVYDIFEKSFIPDNEDHLVEIEINIPYQQKVRYVPTYLYTFKEAWIQYICIFVPIWLVLRLMLYFLLSHTVFSAYIFSSRNSSGPINKKSKIE